MKKATLNILLIEAISQYDIHKIFTRELRSSLKESGRCKVALLSLITKDTDVFDKSFLNYLLRFKPDFVLKINRFKWSLDGKDFFDYFQIPYLNILVDHPLYHLINYTNIKSPYLHLLLTDRSWIKYLEKRLSLKNLFFVPHGGSTQAIYKDQEKTIDIYFAGSYQDPRKIELLCDLQFSAFKEIFFKSIEDILKKEYADVDGSIASNYQILGLTGEYRIDLETIKSIEMPLFQLIEAYTRNKIRFEVISCLKDFNMFICGNGWNDLNLNSENIIVEPPKDYISSLEIMKKSKIILSIAPQSPEGSHERVFDGMAAKCCVFSTKSRYLEEIFKDGEDIVFFDHRDLKSLKEKIEYYLANPEQREEIANSGMQKVLKNHLWRDRALTILDYAERNFL